MRTPPFTLARRTLSFLALPSRSLSFLALTSRTLALTLSDVCVTK